MKKFAIIFITFIIISLVVLRIQANLTQASGLKMTIPEDSIRLRILANSDSKADQEVKREIRDVVNADVTTWVEDLKSYEQAQTIINEHMDDLKKLVQKKLDEKGLNEPFTVSLGPAEFPTKLYGGFVYPAGTYQALVVTLGSGTGANWWCVLFPPLCFLDFEHGDAVKPENHTVVDSSKEAQAFAEQSKKENQIHVKFFVVEWFQHTFEKITDWF